MYSHAIIASLLVASATAAPTNGKEDTSGTTSTPALMTSEKCKALMDAQKAKKTLFWSSDAKSAREAIADKTHYPYLEGHYVMENVFKETLTKTLKNFMTPFERLGATKENNAYESFFTACSEAIADLAEGELYVMLPGELETTGLDWGDCDAGHWAQLEYPIVCKKAEITKLYRLSTTDKTVKEDLTSKMLAQRKQGNCPKRNELCVYT